MSMVKRPLFSKPPLGRPLQPPPRWQPDTIVHSYVPTRKRERRRYLKPLRRRTSHATCGGAPAVAPTTLLEARPLFSKPPLGRPLRPPPRWRPDTVVHSYVTTCKRERRRYLKPLRRRTSLERDEGPTASLEARPPSAWLPSAPPAMARRVKIMKSCPCGGCQHPGRCGSSSYWEDDGERAPDSDDDDLERASTRVAEAKDAHECDGCQTVTRQPLRLCAAGDDCPDGEPCLYCPGCLTKCTNGRCDALYCRVCASSGEEYSRAEMWASVEEDGDSLFCCWRADNACRNRVLAAYWAAEAGCVLVDKPTMTAN